MEDGSDFIDFGFYAETGSAPSLILFDLLLDDISVLSGSTAAPTRSDPFQYIGFSGGEYDTIRLRDNYRGGTSFYGVSGNTLILDALETAGISPVPEPSVLLLFGIGLLGLIGVRWRRKAA